MLLLSLGRHHLQCRDSDHNFDEANFMMHESSSVIRDIHHHLDISCGGQYTMNMSIELSLSPFFF